MWHEISAVCPSCRHRFRRGVVAEQIGELLVVANDSISSVIGKCPRCGGDARAEPWLEEAVELVCAPTRSNIDREALIAVLRGHVDGEPSGDAELETQVPSFGRLRNLLPKDRSERLAAAALLVSIASLVNDIRADVTDDSVTADDVDRLIRIFDQRPRARRSGPPERPGRPLPRDKISRIVGMDALGYDDQVQNAFDGDPRTYWCPRVWGPLPLRDSGPATTNPLIVVDFVQLIWWTGIEIHTSVNPGGGRFSLQAFSESGKEFVVTPYTGLQVPLLSDVTSISLERSSYRPISRLRIWFAAPPIFSPSDKAVLESWAPRINDVLVIGTPYS